MSKEVKVLTAKVVNNMYELTWYIPNNKILWNKTLERIKMIPGRYPDKDAKGKFIWKCPVNPRTSSLLTDIGFRIKEEKVKEAIKPKKEFPPLSLEYKNTPLTNVTDKARQYQLDNIKKIKFHNYNLLEASDMGVGKSLILMSILRESKLLPALIVCPSTLKLNLKRECELWLDPKDNIKVHVVRALPTGLDLNYKDANICIINNDMLFKHLQYIVTEFKPVIVAVDEVHNFKSSYKQVSKYFPDYVLKSNEEVRVIGDRKVICSKPPQRVQALDAILMGLSEEDNRLLGIDWKGVNHFLPMSGTPMPETPADIFNILHWLDPQRFKDREKFIDFFCTTEPGFKANTVKITGSKNLDILNNILLKDYMVRVTKDEVLTELPKTTKMVIPLELDPDYRVEYDSAESNFKEWVAQLEEGEIDKNNPKIVQAKRAQFKTLLDLSRDGKLKNCFKYVDGLMKVNPNKKYVIFCHHRTIVEQVMEHYGKKAVKLIGGMSDEDKETSVQAFQKDKKIKIFVGNLRAASVGVTLTASDTVIFFETGFSSHIVAQAQDRVRRISQESDIVQSIFLPGENTIERYIIEKLDKKKAMADKAIDGIDTSEEDMLSWIWDQMLKS